MRLEQTPAARRDLARRSREGAWEARRAADLRATSSSSIFHRCPERLRCSALQAQVDFAGGALPSELSAQLSLSPPSSLLVDLSSLSSNSSTTSKLQESEQCARVDYHSHAPPPPRPGLKPPPLSPSFCLVSESSSQQPCQSSGGRRALVHSTAHPPAPSNRTSRLRFLPRTAGLLMDKSTPQSLNGCTWMTLVDL